VDARALVWTCRGLGTPAAGRCEGSGLDLPRKQDDQYREVDFQPQGCLRAAAVAGNVRKSWKIRLTWLVAPVLSKRMLTGCGCFSPAREKPTKGGGEHAELRGVVGERLGLHRRAARWGYHWPKEGRECPRLSSALC